MRSVVAMAQSGVTTRTRIWKRLEYERLVECGFFRPDEAIELLRGQLIIAGPQGSLHAVAVGLASEALRAASGPGWVIREEKPVALDDNSEPEPHRCRPRHPPRLRHRASNPACSRGRGR